MEPSVVRLTLSLIGPALFLTFSAAFAAAWLIDRRRRYLLLLASACFIFAIGAISQVLYWPRSTGANALVSGFLYTSAIGIAVFALLVRLGKAPPWPVVLIYVVAVVLTLAYFFYLERNLTARVYIQNFAYGAAFIYAAKAYTPRLSSRRADMFLFWALLLFGLQFFVRTPLLIGFSAPPGERAFADSIFWQSTQLAIAALGSGLALSILAVAVSDVIDDLRRERDTDELTDVLNRRGFTDHVQRGISIASDRGEDAGLILCDVDHFKAINDAYGHPVGDLVLKKIARILCRGARKGDVIGRLGGEEFGIFLVGASIFETYRSAERLRELISRADFELPIARRVTCSFGIAAVEKGEGWEQAYNRADKALYHAKAEGRDNVAQPSDLKRPICQWERLRASLKATTARRA